MEIKYDVEKKTHYVTQEAELAPKEIRAIEIRIKNVWVIPAEEIDKVKLQIDQKLTALKGTKFFESAKLLHAKSIERIAQIEEEQSKVVGIKQRIDLYRAHVKQMESLQTTSFSLEAMRKMDSDAETGERVVKFWVSAENPADEPREMAVRAQLPKEITVDDVLDRLDFAMEYDEPRGRFILEKTDTFAGHEVKKYQITIRDVWYIPDARIDFLRKQARKLVKLFIGSSYEDYAKQHGKFISDSLNEIVAIQKEIADSPVLTDRIRAHVLNSQRLGLVKKKIAELQDLLPEIPLSRGKNEAREKIKYLIKKIIQTSDLIQKALGFQPDKPITWLFIFGIIMFLAIFTSVFYMVWLKKLQQNKWVKKPVTEPKKA